jgi:hypothetical protein
MNSSEEIQLGHELRRLAAGQPFTPDLSEIGARARRTHRRAQATRGATAAAALAVGVGGFLAFHGTSGSATAPSAAATPGAATAPSAAAVPGAKASATAPHVETVAYVTAHVETALGNVNRYVLRTDQVQTGPGGDSATNWTDPRTGNDYEILHDSTNGTSIAWLSTYLVNRVLTWKTVEADYSDHAWFVSVIHAAGPIQGSTAGVTSNVMTPAEIKGWLDAGKLTIIGHKEINGHQAIGLRQPWADGYRELWVDSTSFLPLRTITADFANLRGPAKNVRLIGNETWLPRTRSLLNMVNQVHIPAGFHKVAPPQ